MLLDEFSKQGFDIGFTVNHLLGEDNGDCIYWADGLTEAAIPAFVRINDFWKCLAVVFFFVNQITWTDPVAEIALNTNFRVYFNWVVYWISHTFSL